MDTTSELPPEVPYPEPPGTPAQPERVVEAPDTSEVDRRLLEQRLVRLAGPLDLDSATRITAELLLLDGESSRPIRLLINSGEGILAEGMTVVDILELMESPVDTVCIGRAAGPAALVLAAGTGRRSATPHARVDVRCTETLTLEGSADDISRASDEIGAVRERAAELLAARTGRDADWARSQIDEGTPLRAAEAVELGIVDEMGGGHR